MSNQGDAFKAHKIRTERVASQVQSFYKRKEPFRIYHGNTNSTRRTKHDPKKVVSTSDFSNILYIDQEKRIAVVEPNVSMEQLVDATLPLGLVPPVVMEFTAITVGGGFSGTSGESSSFRHGVFDNTIDRIEIVLGDGDIVFASKTENQELYHGAAGSFGTLGVVTLLEVQLVEAGKFVELEYRAVSGPEHAVRVIEEYTADERIQYLDGIMFSRDGGVVIAGRRVSEKKPGLGIQRYLSAWDQWFYLRAEEILTKEIPAQGGYVFEELVPMKDYLFRYDRGAFWGGRYSFQYFLTPFNRLTRWALDDLLHTKTMYRALHKSGLANEYIVQDIGFPYENTASFIDYLDKNFGFYPLWLCPLYMHAPYPLFPNMSPYKEASEQRVMNIGVWGPGPRNRQAFVAANRAIEAKTKALQGMKCLYAHAYYTASEFWSIYDKPAYDSLRTRYRASLLPSVFDKVTSNDDPERQDSVTEKLKSVWPVRGLFGALCVFWDDEVLVSRVHKWLSVLLSPLLVVIVLMAWGLAGFKRTLGLGKWRGDKIRVD